MLFFFKNKLLSTAHMNIYHKVLSATYICDIIIYSFTLQFVFHIYLLVLIGAFSTSTALILSPLVIFFAQCNGIRITAILGGFITLISCFFISFATQIYQVFISFGIFAGIGICLIRNSSLMIIGQQFGNKRELIEIFLSSASGLGCSLMPIILSFFIRLCTCCQKAYLYTSLYSFC